LATKFGHKTGQQYKTSKAIKADREISNTTIN